MRTGRVTVRIDAGSLNAEAARVGRLEVVDMCRRVMNQAIVNCPVDMGFMRGQHTIGAVVVEPTRVVGGVENNAEYAAAVHDGTEARTIRPRNKKALKFKIGSRVVFARSVRLPRRQGRPWLRDAARAVAQSNGWNFDRS